MLLLILVYYDITRTRDGTPELNVYFNIFHWMAFCDRNHFNTQDFRDVELTRRWNDHKFEMLHDCIVTTFNCQRLFVTVQDENVNSHVYTFFCNPLLHKNCGDSVCVLYPYIGGILDGFDENHNFV